MSCCVLTYCLQARSNGLHVHRALIGSFGQHVIDEILQQNRDVGRQLQVREFLIYGRRPAMPNFVRCDVGIKRWMPVNSSYIRTPKA